MNPPAVVITGEQADGSPLSDGLTVNFTAPFDNGYAITKYTVIATPINPPQAAIDYRGVQNLGGGAVQVIFNVTGSPPVEIIKIPSGYLVANITYGLTVTLHHPNTPSRAQKPPYCRAPSNPSTA